MRLRRVACQSGRVRAKGLASQAASAVRVLIQSQGLMSPDEVRRGSRCETRLPPWSNLDAGVHGAPWPGWLAGDVTWVCRAVKLRMFNGRWGISTHLLLDGREVACDRHVYRALDKIALAHKTGIVNK